MGYPLTCTGRNLAYRKSVYDEIGGMTSVGRFVSGDDDLFLHHLRRSAACGMRYAVDPASIVPSIPPRTFKAFFHQRTRHASKGSRYDFPLKTGLIAVYLLNLFLIVLLFSPKFLLLFLVLYSIKTLCESILILKVARRFGQQRRMRVFPLAAILHIPYVLIFGLWGQIGKFQWKDGTYRSRMSESA